MGPILSESKVLYWAVERNGFSEQQGKDYAYGTAFPPMCLYQIYHPPSHFLLLPHGFCFLDHLPAL